MKITIQLIKRCLSIAVQQGIGSSKKMKKRGESKKGGERNAALLEGERNKLDALEKCINKNGNVLMNCPKS